MNPKNAYAGARHRFSSFGERLLPFEGDSRMDRNKFMAVILPGMDRLHEVSRLVTSGCQANADNP